MRPPFTSQPRLNYRLTIVETTGETNVTASPEIPYERVEQLKDGVCIFQATCNISVAIENCSLEFRRQANNSEEGHAESSIERPEHSVVLIPGHWQYVIVPDSLPSQDLSPTNQEIFIWFVPHLLDNAPLSQGAEGDNSFDFVGRCLGNIQRSVGSTPEELQRSFQLLADQRLQRTVQTNQQANLYPILLWLSFAASKLQVWPVNLVETATEFPQRIFRVYPPIAACG